MNIITPIDKLEEVEPLLQEGVDEFYGGFIPKEWIDKYTIYASINQRYFESAQIKTFDDLKAIVDKVHSFGKKFYFTMNSTLYSPSQYDMIDGLIGKLKDVGVDEIIVADVGLILLINQTGTDMPMHISTLGKAYNYKTVEFFRDLGIKRIVLPRHLTFPEMKQIVEKCPDIEYDVFMLIGKCPNIEGYCTFQHTSDKKRWPCEISYDTSACCDSAQSKKSIESQELWSKIERRFSCGLCALKKIDGMKIRALKIVGRGAPLKMKVANVRLLKHAVSLLDENLSDVEYYKRVKAAYKERFGCDCMPHNCYYPEFYNLS
ncbi:peptidase U32 family protein [Thermodesulfobacteriota bacterium]